MATKTTEKPVAEEKKEEVKFSPADYWCDIILEKNTQEKVDSANIFIKFISGILALLGIILLA